MILTSLAGGKFQRRPPECGPGRHLSLASARVIEFLREAGRAASGPLRSILGMGLALAAALLMSACGDEANNDPSNVPSNQPHNEPLQGPPPVSESLDEALSRISEILASGDCDEINGLNPLSRPNLSSDARCQYLLRITDAEYDDSEEFGDLGAVADYTRGGKTISMVLIRDRDGLYHVAFIDPFRGVPSVGTDFPDDFDQAAEDAVNALQARDCQAFLTVASRRFGFGAGDDTVVCPRVENPLLSNLLKPIEGDVHPERIGGNGGYAFYSIETPASFLTIVMAQQTEGKNLPSGISPEIATLPPDAAEYSYVDAYQTNPRHTPPEPYQGSQ
jgi:hypothetical protein